VRGLVQPTVVARVLILLLTCTGCLATRVQLADGTSRAFRPAVAEAPESTAPVHDPSADDGVEPLPLEEVAAVHHPGMARIVTGAVGTAMVAVVTPLVVRDLRTCGSESCDLAGVAIGSTTLLGLPLMTGLLIRGLQLRLRSKRAFEGHGDPSTVGRRYRIGGGILLGAAALFAGAAGLWAATVDEDPDAYVPGKQAESAREVTLYYSTPALLTWAVVGALFIVRGHRIEEGTLRAGVAPTRGGAAGSLRLAF
jgi:hypothetical protein